MYGNNSIVSLRDIGEGRRALLCITSETSCCKSTDVPISMREWYFPNGSAIRKSFDGHSFYRDRDPYIVRLNRRHNIISLNGIFWCIVPSSINPLMTSTIHIGIYDIGQGNVIVCCLISFFSEQEFLRLAHSTLAEVVAHLTVLHLEAL